MAKVSMQTELDVPAQQVWDLVGRFNALPDWHPAIEHSELDNGGQVRKLSLVGGGTIVEQLEQVNDNEHLYTYSILDSPLPVSNYTASIRVRQDASGNGTIIEWSSSFQPAGAPENEAVKIIEDIYQAGFDNLKRIFGM
ncbi:hypothetical protein J2T55_000548 [Methylohalomonas lacus]|uniref:SRPBCC family protein n=1 Tax=Methylohalomonas lacus TaxID=398773 RepID=A0AAE3L0I0_9GAMM|nr:SRPBCC family protein [Methylohalomonas lacus]MCS3902544.1 hypothetical protein [Methylohalomonas lacus]